MITFSLEENEKIYSVTFEEGDLLIWYQDVEKTILEAVGIVVKLDKETLKATVHWSHQGSLMQCSYHVKTLVEKLEKNVVHNGPSFSKKGNALKILSKRTGKISSLFGHVK